jgi:hypothetical protein
MRSKLFQDAFENGTILSYDQVVGNAGYGGRWMNRADLTGSTQMIQATTKISRNVCYDYKGFVVEKVTDDGYKVIKSLGSMPR